MAERHKGKPEDDQQPFLPLSWESDEADRNRLQKPTGREILSGRQAARIEQHKQRQEDELPPPSPSQRQELPDSQNNRDEPLSSSSEKVPTGDQSARLANRETMLPENSLGAMLMRGRENKGLTIDEVARRTRIPRDFIENAEANRFEQLPPAVYSRSYIAQLCRQYGLSPEVCLRTYDQSQADRLAERGSDDNPLVLVIDNDSEDGSTVSYVPRPADRYWETDSGLLSRLPRFAVMFATGLLLVVVLSAVVVQQYRNYRLRRSEVTVSHTETNDTGPAESPRRATGLEELVPPLELPLRKLPIPGE